jgi:hypothetical protein
MTPFPPIHYNRRQVALMVTFAAYLSADFAGQVGEVATRISMIAAGIIAPTPAILEFFGLQRDGRGYVWNPR